MVAALQHKANTSIQVVLEEVLRILKKCFLRIVGKLPPPAAKALMQTVACRE